MSRLFTSPIYRLVLLLVPLALAGCDSQAQESEAAESQAMPPAEVSAAEVIVREVNQWDEFTGRVAAPETVELRPRVSGYIEQAAFREGQEVSKGDVLFVIDDRVYRAALTRAEAELQHAISRRDLSRSEAGRADQLASSKAISREEADRRRAAAAQADADVLVAQAAVDIARLNLEYTQVRAPISGLIGRALVTTGNLAQADVSLLATIVSMDPVHVYFEADEQSYLRYGAMARRGELASPRDNAHPVRVGLAGEAGFPHEGVMDFLDNQVDAATGTIRGRAVLANPDRVFTPGLFARVQMLGSGRFEALLIDDKAVITDQDRQFVYVVGEDGTASRRNIVPGRMIDGLRVVEEGLAPGDRVIVHGVQKVFFPGMPVNAQEIAMGDPPPAAGPMPN